MCHSPIATEGDYIELINPSNEEQNQHPSEGAPTAPPGLNYGCKINIPGPARFPLWPGQIAKVVKGHNLKSNEYAVVRIYNEEEARKNWGKGVVKAAAVEAPNGDGDEPTETKSVVTSDVDELDLTIGKLYNIKGTDCSYYIPPTGVEVLPDEDGNYVRPAETLERGETAILIDEDGNKRYERGPKVVFPEPTEVFQIEKDGRRKAPAEELNVIQGIHVKVIAPYHDDDFEKDFEEGNEIFITGKECAIYYPRPEHKIITYGGRKKHYAVAVPAGEGRYVMEREKGVVKTICGPIMLLPNPVDEVIIRRILDDDQVTLWYPREDGTANPEALAYNRHLRDMLENNDSDVVQESLYATNTGRYLGDEAEALEYSHSKRNRSNDEFSRGTKFTKPREITLDTKYDGVPIICPWTGYAVMVVSKGTDKREVKIGPTTVLLDYDQTLEVLSLSTGKPKTTDRVQRTVYLRIKNNKVSDIIEDVTTGDHVRVSVKLSFRVNFVTEYKGQEIDPEKWFEVENYVKLLCDHVRSMVKGHVRKIENVETFYKNGVDILRDLILGIKDEETGQRPGLFFKENGMLIEDVEVLAIDIVDEQVRRLLDQAQFEAVSGGITVGKAERELNIKKRKEELQRESMQADDETAILKHKLDMAKVEREKENAVARIIATIEESQKQLESANATEDVTDLHSARELARDKNESDQGLAIEVARNDEALRGLKEQTEAVVKRFSAAQGGLTEALMALGNQDTVIKVAEAISVQKMIGGENVGDLLQSIFAGTPLDDAFVQAMQRAGTKVIPGAAPKSEYDDEDSDLDEDDDNGKW